MITGPFTYATFLERFGVDAPVDSHLSIWTVYDSPLDYPGKFVARRWHLTAPTDDLLVADTLAEIHTFMNLIGLHRIVRNPNDDPVIVETWI